MGDEGKETIIDATVWNTETSKVSTFYGERYDKEQYFEMMGVGYRRKINVSVGRE